MGVHHSVDRRDEAAVGQKAELAREGWVKIDAKMAVRPVVVEGIGCEQFGQTRPRTDLKQASPPLG